MEAWREELYHHGIKGQKWGVRRYQNADGTLTEAGKKRISSYQERETSLVNRQYDRKIQKDNERAAKYLSKYASETKNAKRKERYINAYADASADAKFHEGLRKAELRAIKKATLESIKDERKAVVLGETACVAASAASIAGMATGVLPMAFIITADPAVIKTERRVSDSEAEKIAAEAYGEISKYTERGRRLVEGN